MAHEKTPKSYLQRLTFNPKLATGFVASYLKSFRITILLILAIVFLGLAAYLSLPRRLNPEVKIPIVTIFTLLPGASPEDVESLVTIPLENAVASLEGLATLNSVSRDNISILTLEFTSTTNQDKAKEDVQSAIDAATTLANDAETPTVTALDFENQPIWELAISTQSDLRSLETFARNLKNRLEQDPALDHVEVSGLEDKEIVVSFTPETLTQYGITAPLLAQNLRAALSPHPAGAIDTNTNSFSLTIDKSIKTIADIRDIRLRISQKTVPLEDIAQVAEKSEAKQPLAFLGKNGEDISRIVTLQIFKTKTSKITDSGAKAKKIVDRELALYNNKFEALTIQNTADEISTQFDELVGEFRTTILLVFACLFIFLGLRQAIISSLTVPLTFLSAFVLMQVFGMSINFLSLFAFLLSLGLLVDDTIVVISAMTSYYRTGKFTPFETGLLVWRDTIVPIWSTTITTIWSFVPLLLSTGIIGEFIKPIPIVVTVTMVSSTAIAVLITVPIMIIILKPNFPKRVITFLKILGVFGVVALGFILSSQNPLFIGIFGLFFAFVYVAYRVRNQLSHKVQKTINSIEFLSKTQQFLAHSSDQGIISIEVLSEKYKRFIARILKSKSARRKAILAIVAYAVVGFLLIPAGLVKNEFFPKTETDILYIGLELPAGTTLSKTNQQTVKLLSQLKERTDISYVVAAVGRSAPTGFGGSESGENISLFTLHLPEEKIRKKSSIDLAEELRKTYQNYQDAKLSIVELSGGPPAGSDLQIELSGDELSQLSIYSDSLVAQLEKEPGVANAQKSIKPGTSAITFVPDKEKLAQAGIGVETIALWTRTYGSGFPLGEINLDGEVTEETPIRLAVSHIPTVEDLGKITITAPTGESLPLLSLGRLQLSPNPTAITRKNQKRTMTVTAAVRPGFSAVEKNQKLIQFADTINLPQGYTWETGGVNEENARSVQSILLAMGVSFLLILVTMVLQFNSFRQAAIVLMVIPLAVSSVFYIFGLTGTPLSFPAIIGVLSLFGIVVTNSMFIVDKMNINQKQGMKFDDALADAGASRLEPIVLTKLATVLGLLPITLADPLWRGLGGAIISGILVASTIMLVFIPSVYYELMKPKASRH